MRYTTIIDISQAPALYRNLNVRLVYLHLALKAGYHDHDRDICVTSIRRLAADVGISVSATRHALKLLLRYKMIAQGTTAYSVRKWCEEQPISTRRKSQQLQAQQDQQQAAAKERKDLAKRQREDRKYFEDLKAQGLTSLDVYKAKLRERAAQGDAEAAELLKRHETK